MSVSYLHPPWTRSESRQKLKDRPRRRREWETQIRKESGSRSEWRLNSKKRVRTGGTEKRPLYPKMLDDSSHVFTVYQRGTSVSETPKGPSPTISPTGDLSTFSSQCRCVRWSKREWWQNHYQDGAISESPQEKGIPGSRVVTSLTGFGIKEVKFMLNYRARAKTYLRVETRGPKGPHRTYTEDTRRS